MWISLYFISYCENMSATGCKINIFELSCLHDITDYIHGSVGFFCFGRVFDVHNVDWMVLNLTLTAFLIVFPFRVMRPAIKFVIASDHSINTVDISKRLTQLE